MSLDGGHDLLQVVHVGGGEALAALLPALRFTQLALQHLGVVLCTALCVEKKRVRAEEGRLATLEWWKHPCLESQT